MENDPNPNAQIGEENEVAELRWDGATELIHGESPKKATMKER